MIRVADYICRRLSEHGVTHAFLVTGGGAMHLNDALVSSPIAAVCTHHEQGAAVAGEGYARATGKLGFVMVTTGPGATNAITGLFGAYTDSAPVLFVSGQVKRETCMTSYGELGLRQLGDQEVDIVSMVQHLTKSAVRLTDPKRVRYELERAIFVAESGRKGPVWIDVPVDVQGSLIDPEALEGYSPPLEVRFEPDPALVERAAELLRGAKRPLVVGGQGVRLAGAEREFLALLDEQEFASGSTLLGFDQVPTEHPSHVGRIGTIGDRAGNFALQNADVVLFIGTRNNIRQASYGFSRFARSATKIVVDIDQAELQKPTVKPDVPILADAAAFIAKLRVALGEPSAETLARRREFRSWGKELGRRYPTVLPEYTQVAEPISPYVFMDRLARALPDDAIVVTANATACICYFQAGLVREGQRVIWNSGSASMGYGLPAAIGAAAGTGRTVVCLEGEGSLMMNLQELETLRAAGFNVHVFVLENGGYVSIRQTQTNFFQGRYIGTGPDSGVSFPETSALGAAFRLPFERLSRLDDLDALPRLLSKKGPSLVGVRLPLDYAFSPKTSSVRRADGTMVSRPLEDMAPFLPRDEFRSVMLVPPLEED